MAPSIKHVFTTVANSFADILAVKTCLICNKPIDNNFRFSYICPKCFYNLPAADSSELIINRLMQTFASDDIGISNATSLFSLKDSEFLEIIHHLKYYGLYQIGYEFGILLGEKLKTNGLIHYDFIFPVPIHSAKKRERGYNQSYFIAKGINKILKTEINENLIKRAVYTKSQTTLNAMERKKNIEGIYQLAVPNELISNKTILVVDDVFTTGSTINHLALTFLNFGVKKVDCATLALT
ncbi:MAG: ComF family protein [Candidatus Kapaibacteriota bacterium]